jgi:NADPH:quinone reductase-like Zn-dependent oxidoreductase
MRAWAVDRYGVVDDLRLHEIPAPVVRPGGVLVRVRAAAVNPADWKVVTGKQGGRFLHAAKFPLVPGYDFSGVVEAVGEGATLRAGDEVYGFLPYRRSNAQGSFAEYVAVPADTVAVKPAGTSHEEAACAATSASTALQGLRDKGGLAAGQRVLVNGASGGVGSYVVQVARNAGAEVWGTCSAAKMDAVAKLGATRVIDRKATPLASLDAKFDIVYDAASMSSYGECARLLTPAGAYVTLLPNLGLGVGMLRTAFSARRCGFVIVASRADDLTQIAGWMAEGRLTHLVDSTFPFDRVPDAVRRMQSGAVQGKIAVTVA